MVDEDDFPFLLSSRQVRIAGLFQQLALWLDEAAMPCIRSMSDPTLVVDPMKLTKAFGEAAKVCVELAHAVLEK